MKEALKNPKMVDLLVQAFWDKQMSVGLANKVLHIFNDCGFTLYKVTEGLVVLRTSIAFKYIHIACTISPS